MSEGRTAEQKAEAVACYAEHGLAEAHRQSGVPKTTLQRWARDAGLDLSAIAAEHATRTIAATEARTVRCEAMRLELRERMLEQAGALLDRIDQPQVEFRGKDAERVEYPVATPSACRDLVVSVAVLIDKYRLEVGEVTDRTQVSAVSDEVERTVRMRDQLAERRERQPVAASA